MDIGRDHGEPVGDAGGRQPEVVRTDQGAGSPENGPHLCVRARRGEIDLQEGEALQNAFDANAERLARCRGSTARCTPWSSSLAVMTERND